MAGRASSGRQTVEGQLRRKRMGESISGKVAVVTGASAGYGLGIASVLAEAGVRVWMTARGEEALCRAAEKVGGRAIRADVSVAGDWDRVVRTVTEDSGRLDILVNNAGAGVAVLPLDDQTDLQVETALGVNLTGAIYGCRRAAAIMKKQKAGSIVNISSVCAVQAWPGFSVYSAAKAGMLQLSRCLHTELRPFGVRVSCLIPSWGATDWGKAAGMPEMDPETRARSIQPRELGRIVADLCALPAHLVVQEMVLWPMVQEVIPL
jgi:NAD(P)-dependent dehydrogenase (short-subunit alcohol dehydrogenase family)